ncbi:hypothetical protein JK169_13340 [Acetobacter persici]|uniref:hypothetical protein n=1 Tax=Acetobacter persici TaxID=1076596 RepID=UPI001BA96ABA|nr:hypothetical protein [Acetobacter persici]MBS1001980.1 hypothetical protein [Acetobacter persici]
MAFHRKMAGGVFARHKVFTEQNTDFTKLYHGLFKNEFCPEGVECLRMDAGHGSCSSDP